MKDLRLCKAVTTAVRYLPVADLDAKLVEVIVEFCAHIRRSLCYQDEPWPENNREQIKTELCYHN